MEIDEQKHRRVPTEAERAERRKEADRRTLDHALAEQDMLDALVRRSIELEGP